MSEFVITIDGREIYRYSGKESPSEATLFFEDESVVRVQSWLRWKNGKIVGDNWEVVELRPVANSDSGVANSDSGGVTADELGTAFRGAARYHMGKDVRPDPETMRKVWDE